VPGNQFPVVTGFSNLMEDEMSRYVAVMLGGIAMTSIMGALMIWWLTVDEGSGFVGMLYIAGMLVGMAVFAGSAAEAVREPGRHAAGDRHSIAEKAEAKREAIQ
jgi:hypothetical protein